MRMSSIHLNEWCLSRHPVIQADPSLTRENASKRWAAPIVVLTNASYCLREDLKTLVDTAPHQNEGILKQFLLGARHHTDVLLYPTFLEISRLLEPYNDVKADNLSLKGDRPSLGQLLSFASDHILQLGETWENVVDSIGIPPEDLPVSPPSQVPTAAPRELLLHLLVNRPQMVEKISQDGIGTVLAHISEYIETRFSRFPPREKIKLERRVANGTPKMYFVCYHRKRYDNARFFVGANEADWRGVGAIKRIRRKDRDHRLEAYIPLAKKAYDALHEAEQKAEIPASYASYPEERRRYEKRRRAVATMRGGLDPPRPDFLGRQNEYGQAFNGSMKAFQCCYACQGMMGYKIPASFSDEDVEKTLLHFDWIKRHGYAHSCAEISVSMQCASEHEREGRDIKT